MRISKGVLAGALALAGCGGPSESDIVSAQAEMNTCTTTVLNKAIPGLTQTQGKLTSVELPIKPSAGKTDFYAYGYLKPYDEKTTFKDKPVTATVEASISFTGAAGRRTVSISGFKNSISSGGGNARFEESLDTSKPYAIHSGDKASPVVDLKAVASGLQNCANAAHAKLEPKQG